MMKTLTGPLFASLLATAACGTSEFHSSSSFNNGSATPAGAQLASGTAGQSGDATAANCPGVAPHGDHATCDEADNQVSSGSVPAPTPAPVAAKPVVPAPAAAPAPAPTPTAANTAPATATATAVATATSTGAATDPNLVEFHIVAGTGAKGYNTAATPVTVKVGQTLRLYNDDTVAHRLHTGGQPTIHEPGNTAPGAFYDAVITSAFDATTNGAVYDHIAGPTSVFFLKAVP